MSEKSYSVEGMACEGCAKTVEEKTSALAGVESAHVDFDSKTLEIKGDFNEDELKRILSDGGFSLS